MKFQHHLSEYRGGPEVMVGRELSNSVDYYVLSVASGLEGRFEEFSRKTLSQDLGKIIWPRRELVIKKKGIKVSRNLPLYPGYIFWEASKLFDEAVVALRRIPGFIKFLKRDGLIKPITIIEKEMFCQLMSDGDVLSRSDVAFDENNRIRVVSGPLSMFEGKILWIDRRKERARVLLSLHGKSMEIDLGFKVMIPVHC